MYITKYNISTTVPCACSSCGSPTSNLSQTSPTLASTATDPPTTTTNLFNNASFTPSSQPPQPFYFQTPQPTQFFDTSILQTSNLDSIKEDDDATQTNLSQHPSIIHPSHHDQSLPIDPLSFLQQTAHDYLMKQQQLQLQNQQQQQQLLEALHQQQQFILQQELIQSSLLSNPSTFVSPSSQHLPRISITDHSGHIIHPSSFAVSNDVDMLQDASSHNQPHHSPHHNSPHQQSPHPHPSHHSPHHLPPSQASTTDQIECDTCDFEGSYDHALR